MAKTRLKQGKSRFMVSQGSGERLSDERRVALRILSLREAAESDADFAKRLGISPQRLNGYKNQDRGASLDVVFTVARKLGLSPTWILTGEGPKKQVHGESEGKAALVDVRDRLIGLASAITSDYGLPGPDEEPGEGEPTGSPPGEGPPPQIQSAYERFRAQQRSSDETGTDG